MTEKEVDFRKKGGRSWDKVAFWCKRVWKWNSGIHKWELPRVGTTCRSKWYGKAVRNSIIPSVKAVVFKLKESILIPLPCYRTKRKREACLNASKKYPEPPSPLPLPTKIN